MTEQRYEYETVEIGSQQHRGPGAINDMAQDGWQLVETLGIKGTSAYLVFERPTEVISKSNRGENDGR